MGSTVNAVQNVSGSHARQRKTSEQRGTIVGLLLRQRGARSRLRGASFGCMALLSTCTKARGPWELIFLDTRPLIFGLRPFTLPYPQYIHHWHVCRPFLEGEGNKSLLGYCVSKTASPTTILYQFWSNK